MRRLRTGIVVVLALVVVSGAVSLAQRFGVFEGAGAGIRTPPKDFHDRGFTVCKWMFRSDRSEPSGIGWSTDYPFGEINLLTRISEFTNGRVSHDRGGDINYWVVQLSDEPLFECPMLIGSDVGIAALSNTEVQRLREYLLKGGFLWVDDFWGSRAWSQWTSQVTRVLPEFPIVDVAAGRSDPARAVQHQRGQARCQASLRGAGPAAIRVSAAATHANFRAIADAHGRIMVAMTHNTDIGDSMEREGNDPAYFAAFSPDGYALATNIVLHVLTH